MEKCLSKQIEKFLQNQNIFMLINDVVSSLIARMTRVICSNFRMVFSLNKINVYLNNLDNLDLLKMLSYQTISLDNVQIK